jgi:hypothetical protein
MALANDDQEVQTLSAQCTDDALSDGVCLRRVHWSQDLFDADLGRPRDEAAFVATIAVPDQRRRQFGYKARGQAIVESTSLAQLSLSNNREALVAPLIRQGIVLRKCSS